MLTNSQYLKVPNLIRFFIHCLKHPTFWNKSRIILTMLLHEYRSNQQFKPLANKIYEFLLQFTRTVFFYDMLLKMTP